jgi:flagellar L-ring protein precursor FlgH
MTVSRSVRTSLIFCVLIFTAGCSSNLYLKADHPQNIPQETKREPLPGAIWAGENATNSLFADRRARSLNDIVTIVVNETATGSNNGNTTTSRDTTTTAAVTNLLGLEGAIQDLLRQGTTGISVAGTQSNSLKGAGATTRDGNLTATISARVVKILESGNFVIEGRRQVTINAEDQYLIITGIIRPDDIAFDNTIQSQYISDAKLAYTGKGVVNDKMRPGWLTRIVDWVWPF